MGLFESKKIKLEKIMKEDTIQYFIDYHKQKNPDGFLLDFIQDLIEDKNCLLVINTDNFYTKNSTDAENKITELKKELDQQEISYRQVVTKKEADNRIFGFKIQSSEKVNSYQVGLAVTPDQIRKVTGTIKDFNVFYYIFSKDMDSEKLFAQFYDVRGDYDELNKSCKYSLFHDSYFHRLRICSGQDLTSFIETKMQRYL